MKNAKTIACSSIYVKEDTTLFHTGPSLDRGKLPSIFYFALSGEDSLCKDPFNQPVQFLSEYPIRIFSMTLPAHEANLSPHDALKTWAQDLEKGRDIISEFIDKALIAIDYLYQKSLIDTLAVAGLSRGGFIASHLAAKEKRIKHILQFAPLTELSNATDFINVRENPLVKSLSVSHLKDDLYDRHIRFYIGNNDQRVHTSNCFHFLQTLVKTAKKNNIRTPQIEMIISPSIGHQGHGTGPEIFKQGAHWLAKHISNN